MQYFTIKRHFTIENKIYHAVVTIKDVTQLFANGEVINIINLLRLTGTFVLA